MYRQFDSLAEGMEALVYLVPDDIWVRSDLTLRELLVRAICPASLSPRSDLAFAALTERLTQIYACCTIQDSECVVISLHAEKHKCSMRICVGENVFSFSIEPARQRGDLWRSPYKISVYYCIRNTTPREWIAESREHNWVGQT